MKKIRLFSAKVIRGIEGEEAELYVDFYLVLNRHYIFTFLIEAPNIVCSDRHFIRLWRIFRIMLEEEYMRRYEKKTMRRKAKIIIEKSEYAKTKDRVYLTKETTSLR